MTDPGVTYTVRELLDRADRRADERHAEMKDLLGGVKKDVHKLAERTDALEAAEDRRASWAAFGGKAWIGAIAVLGVIVNIPAALYYLNGGHP